MELDIVFERYWKSVEGELDETEAAALAQLLALPDNDLLDLVMGRADTPEAHLRALVEKLRSR